jgi:hypothetical protein
LPTYSITVKISRYNQDVKISKAVDDSVWTDITTDKSYEINKRNKLFNELLVKGCYAYRKGFFDELCGCMGSFYGKSIIYAKSNDTLVFQFNECDRKDNEVVIYYKGLRYLIILKDEYVNRIMAIFKELDLLKHCKTCEGS